MNTNYAYKYALKLCTLLFICTITFISCEDNPTSDNGNNLFVYKNVNQDLYHNDIEARLGEDSTGALIVQLLITNSEHTVDEEQTYVRSYNNQDFYYVIGYTAGRYIFNNRVIFTYAPETQNHDRLYVKCRNYDGSKIYFDVCIKYK